MTTNPRYSQYGGASSPNRATGVYTGKITLIYDDGRVRVFINTFGRNIGPCRIINKSAGDAIALNDEVLCTYANDTSDELIVVGRLTERVDPVSESTSGLVVEASTTSELVRITQKGTGAALLVEDSTNPDSTPFIIDASGNVGIGLLSPSAKVDISGSAVISGDLTIDTTTLKVDSSNNRVGIGTASPLSKLHIADASGYGVQINTTTNLGLIGSNGESDGLRISGGIPDELTVGGNIYLYGNSHATRAADVAIQSNGTEVLTVDSTGRVGIGTVSPTEKLDVAGNIALTGSVVFEGATADAFETTLSVTDPTADRTITLPNNTGTVALLGDTTYVGTTAITLNRSSANLNLTGITSVAMPGSTSGTTTLQASAVAGTTTVTFPAFSGTVITTGNLSSITSVGTLTGLTLSGTVTLPNSANNQIYTSTTADSALPWANGPVLQGATGWSFYSAISASYRMGFRGNTAGTTKYFWTADSALIGAQPNDYEVTNTLNVMGTGRFTGTVTTEGNVVINNSSPTIYLKDTDNRSAMIHVNSNLFYVLRGNGNNSETWETVGGYWPLQIDLENNNATFGGTLFAPGSATCARFITNNASPSLELGDWSSASTWSAVEGYNGYLLLGNTSNRACYLRTNNGAAVNIGANGSDTLVVNNGNIVVNGTTANSTLNVIGGTGWFSAMSAGSGATVVNYFGFLQYVSSRRELKENIVSILSSDGLNRILALRPVEFTMKPEYLADANEYTPFDVKRGFIAQEVAEVDHRYGQWGWVDENQMMATEPAIKGELPLEDATPIYWNHDAVIADLVASIQVLTARIFELEATQ